MEKQSLMLKDIITFGLIASIAAFFGFCHRNSDTALVGRAVYGISLVLIAFAPLVKRRS